MEGRTVTAIVGVFSTVLFVVLTMAIVNTARMNHLQTNNLDTKLMVRHVTYKLDSEVNGLRNENEDRKLEIHNLASSTDLILRRSHYNTELIQHELQKTVTALEDLHVIKKNLTILAPLQEFVANQSRIQAATEIETHAVAKRESLSVPPESVLKWQHDLKDTSRLIHQLAVYHQKDNVRRLRYERFQQRRSGNKAIETTLTTDKVEPKNVTLAAASKDKRVRRSASPLRRPSSPFGRLKPSWDLRPPLDVSLCCMPHQAAILNRYGVTKESETCPCQNYNMDLTQHLNKLVETIINFTKFFLPSGDRGSNPYINSRSRREITSERFEQENMNLELPESREQSKHTIPLLAFSLIQMVINQLAATFHQPEELIPLEELINDIQEARDPSEVIQDEPGSNEFKQAVDKWVQKVNAGGGQKLT